MINYLQKSIIGAQTNEIIITELPFLFILSK